MLLLDDFLFVMGLLCKISPQVGVRASCEIIAYGSRGVSKEVTTSRNAVYGSFKQYKNTDITTWWYSSSSSNIVLKSFHATLS